MSTVLLKRLDQELAELSGRARLRALKSASGADFASNDYLGLSRHPALAEAARAALERSGLMGSGGSRLLRGNHAEHEELERAAAAFFNAPSAIFFNSGFDANLALFSALPSRRAAIILDERVHASVKEGARASFARKYTARHNDLASFEAALRRARAAGARDLFLAAESVYSMEGDIAPLSGLLDLARRHEAVLILDEAHSTGVLGASGRGLAEGTRDPLLITLHTCGKALGVCGALVCASRAVKDYLVNTARPFLYSTALPPMLAAAVRRALEIVDEEAWRRENLLRLIPLAADKIGSALSRWRLGARQTQILPVLIGGEEEAVRAAAALQARGLDVRAIRTPTVPEDQARLRISLNALHSPKQIEALAQALREAEDHA